MYNDNMTLLLTTKFYPPPLPNGFVARPQLFEKLDEALTRRLTLVSAPAGAGKTTLVSAWAQAKRQSGQAAFGWLSLDDADNAPGRFWEYLMACLEEGGARFDSSSSLPEQDETSSEAQIPPGLVRSWLNLKAELLLILDDYHIIQNRGIHAALGDLLEHTPLHLHLVLLTRSDPPLELARLRVLGQLAEIRMEQLRFSAEEAARFLENASAVRLSPADLALLNARAEGWAAGLQMAAISLRGRSDTGAFVAAFAGSHRFVFDYLLEQVLSRQSLEVREFLLKISVLERFCAPLCAAVIGSGEARQYLDTLERDNLFLVPLDDERGWYRFHHLFADLLKLMLEQEYPGQAGELHRRASGWYEAQGLIPEALSHALTAGDLELATRLVSVNALALVEQTELNPILMRMEAALRAEKEFQPWLAVAHAWALAYAGQMERAGAVLTHFENNPPPMIDKRLRGHLAAAQAYIEWVKGNQSAAIAYAEMAAAYLPPEEIAVRSLNLTTLGNALIQKDNYLPRAVEVLEQAVMLARQDGKSHVLMPAETALAYTYTGLGRFHRAHEICIEAIETADKHLRQHGQPLLAVASAFAVLSIIFSEWGEIEKSIQAARKGLALSELWGQADSMMMCLLQLANSLSLAGDPDGARQAILRARSLGQKVSPWFMLIVSQLDVRISLDANDVHHATLIAENILADSVVSFEVRLRIHQNRLEDAAVLLGKVLHEQFQTSPVETVRLLSLQALALFLKADEKGALAALKQAIRLAQDENLVQAFIREGEAMERLLRRALARSIFPEFTRRVLTIIEARRRPTPAPAGEALIEPLSEREMEILALLDGPLSTPEMAARLIVSANTVRTHIKNIYGKLGVHGRSGAVQRAQALGILHNGPR